MLKNDLIQPYLKPLSPRPTSLQAGGVLKDDVRCILFDVYGLEKLLQKFGIQKAPHVILDDFFTAIDNDHKKQRANGVDFPEVKVDRIWMQVLNISDMDIVRAFAVEFELMANPVYPMPHLEALLAGCRELNLALGIISNAQFYTPHLFKWLLGAAPEDLGFHPQLLLYSYKFGYAKPSTHMFEAAVAKLQNMGIPVKAALYLGNDMRNDIYPAQKVGFQTALFAGDARSLRLREDDPLCKNITPDIVVTDLGQLLNHIR
jgi:putative hydrolase of the HAD superfamily